MGKKRKAGGRPYGEPNSMPENQNSKLKISTFEDVADSEDEFHLNRDKILLDEGPQAKRMRKWREQDEFLQPSDEEVLAYSSPEEDEEELEEEDGGEDFGDEDGLSDDDFGLRKRRPDEEEDEDLGGWGPSKKDYYNADAIETEQDALDEEAEARRIQQKQLQGMTEADFGFDESEWLGQEGGDEDKEGHDVGDIVTEILPQLQITDEMGTEERLKILRTRYPEFDHLAKEFLRLQPLHDELAHAANAAEKLVQMRAARKSLSNDFAVQTPVAVVKHRALSAYLAAITMYFAILTSTASEKDSTSIAISPAELRDHSVIEGLLKCQQLWSKVESLQIADPMVELTNGDDLSAIDEESGSAADTNGVAIAEPKSMATSRKVKKTKAQRAAEAAQAEAEARRAEKIRRTEEELAGLASLTDQSALRKAAKLKKATPAAIAANADDSDFGEETPLTAQEMADKAKKKKSLRFYTSQIAQKANKRGAAGRDQGGDADVPHRERLKDRQARLQAEAEKRGRNKQGPGDELGGESDPEDYKQRGDGQSNDDDYYDLVTARSKQKKQAKQDLADAYAQAAAEGGRVVPTEEISADGKRKISYLIEKNKGLTPKRNKVARNPRVKKKLKYEAKKKKLKSQKATYSGGEGRGGYKGELTGIKKGLVKSVKL